MRYGASPEAWQFFANHLNLKVDLLPVVSNPEAEVSEHSKMKGLGKTPSVYNREGKVAGIAEWTQLSATNGHINWWSQQPDYGICVQTRQLGAFDIDVDDQELARAIYEAIVAVVDLPFRWRENSGKLLLAFRRDFPLFKRVLPVEGGMVEILGTGQQFVACGDHPSGVPYQWNDDMEIPEHIPAITEDQFNEIWDKLVLLHATGDPKIAREKRERVNEGEGSDEVSKWLAENWECHGNGEDGRLYIRCPFDSEHTTDSGPSSTAYFPAGTGGYQRGHFVCLHAHCVGREDHDFLEATGYGEAQFEALDEPAGRDADGGTRSGDTGLSVASAADAKLDPLDALPQVVGSTRDDPWPTMVRSKDGKIEPSALNLVKALYQGGMIGRWVAYDAFTDELVWADKRQPIDHKTRWKRLADAEVTYIRMQLEQRGFKALGAQLLRESLFAAGRLRAMDSAQEWLRRREWDGVRRIETFAVDVWGWTDTPYARAVGRYVWTALAGRIIEPGVQADMAPILVGLQGIRKTSAIKAMAPHADMYTEIRLDAKDEDQSRALRGKLVGEIEELRGLNSRAIEEIKAFVSRRRESWIPKFKEFENHFDRRCLLIGSTNETEFLADPTGERRWLPGLCHFINIDLLRETRDQLWAEGAQTFIMDGVAWQEAERLAEQEHPRFKISDSWEKTIRRYLEGVDEELSAKPLDKGHVTVEEIMLHALFISSQHQNRGHEVRVQKALKAIGLKRQEDGSWTR